MKTKLDKSKKEDANIRAELRQIKVELLKIAGDMKHYRTVQDNQTKLLAEVNSLKAILTSRYDLHPCVQ
jgi:cysteinyl-tRNA synthetase